MDGDYLKQITWSAGAFWISTYLVLVLAPLFILLTGERPDGSGFWWDFAMALGFAGLTMMGVQFYLTARLRGATAPFGIDIIYFFHRYLAIFSITLILAHPFILIFIDPALQKNLNPLKAPWYMTAGTVSLSLFAVIIGSSLWRKQLKLEYDLWRVLHTVLSVVAVILALIHIEFAGKYTGGYWKKLLFVFIVLTWILLLVYIRLVKPWFISKKPYRVLSVVKERGDAWVLTIEPDGHPGIDFLPGQFAWLTLRKSPFMLKEHPFSISSGSTDPSRLEFTIKEYGDFTRSIRDVKAGEIAFIDGPYGAFSVDRYAARGHVFIAGGVGIAPIMSMLRTLADRSYSRPLYLFYCNRSWDLVIFREDLEDLKTRLNLHVVHILEQPPENWIGESGYPTREILEDHLPVKRQKFDYYICGPEPMIKVMEKALFAMKVPLRRSHTEIFNLV